MGGTCVVGWWGGGGAAGARCGRPGRREGARGGGWRRADGAGGGGDTEGRGGVGVGGGGGEGGRGRGGGGGSERALQTRGSRCAAAVRCVLYPDEVVGLLAGSKRSSFDRTAALQAGDRKTELIRSHDTRFCLEPMLVGPTSTVQYVRSFIFEVK